MADIELVIKIPEEQYKTLNAVSQDDVVAVIDDALLIKAIKNGIPLPKHYGRLLILDERIVERNLVSFNATTSFCNKWLSEVGLSNSVIKIIPETGRSNDEGSD